MITLAHGNDIVSSRIFYIEQRSKNPNALIIEGKTLTFEQIYQAVEGSSLFTDDMFIYVENFFANIKTNSSEFKKIADFLNSSKKINIFFWEAKELSKSQASTFKNALVKAFSFPSTLFLFLDGLKPNNLRLVSTFKNLENVMETELIFYMIVRQFRLLISTLESNISIDEIKRIQPWQKTKLLGQTNYFGEKKLVELYKKLYEIDYKTKFGLTPFSLSASIDIFLSNL